jgi:hypothetical protein
MDGDEKMTPVDLVFKWLMANGKEALAFVAVMVAALYMFNDMRDESRANRQQAADRETRDRQSTADRETKSWQHAKEMREEMAENREAIKDLTRALKGVQKP